MKQPSRWYILLKQIWPYINRAINTVFYFVIGVIKSIVKIGMRQMKGGGDF